MTYSYVVNLTYYNSALNTLDSTFSHSILLYVEPLVKKDQTLRVPPVIHKYYTICVNKKMSYCLPKRIYTCLYQYGSAYENLWGRITVTNGIFCVPLAEVDFSIRLLALALGNCAYALYVTFGDTRWYFLKRLLGLAHFIPLPRERDRQEPAIYPFRSADDAAVAFHSIFSRHSLPAFSCSKTVDTVHETSEL